MISYLREHIWQNILNVSYFYIYVENQLKKMHLFKKIYNIIYKIKIEPTSKWTNYSWIDPTSEKTILDSYYNAKYTPKDNHYLYIHKDSNYFIRESRGNIKNVQSYIYFANLQPFYSNVTFICIEYSHSKLKQNIRINLDIRYFIIGNEILSSTFIARYLDYTYGLCFYHNDYILHLIDNNMDYFTMDRNNYLFIDKDSYKVKTF